MRYTVSYDLRAPGRNYQQLYDELARYNGQRLLDSEWIIRAYNTSSEAVRDHLRQRMDQNDRLLVTEFDGAGAAWVNLLFNPNDIQK